MQRLETLAKAGNLEAQWELSCKLRWGARGLPVDIREANRWLTCAGTGGCGEAQHHLAWYCETGQYDFPIDLAESEQWYRRAFEQRHPETLYLFAIRLFKYGIPTDESIALLREAAAKELKQAEHVLQAHTH